jgi:hypothetical protein
MPFIGRERLVTFVRLTRRPEGQPWSANKCPDSESSGAATNSIHNGKAPSIGLDVSHRLITGLDILALLYVQRPQRSKDPGPETLEY